MLFALGAVLATEDVPVTAGTLRQTLHGTLARVAPGTIEEALTVTPSEGASHFQLKNQGLCCVTEVFQCSGRF